MSSIPRAANLALAFLLELAALVAVGLWGARFGSMRISRALLSVLAAVAWAGIWGLLFSPRSRVTLPPIAKQVGQLGMFVVAALALGAAGHWVLAAVFGALVVVNRVLIAVWGQEAAQQELARSHR